MKVSDLLTALKRCSHQLRVAGELSMAEGLEMLAAKLKPFVLHPLAELSLTAIPSPQRPAGRVVTKPSSSLSARQLSEDLKELLRLAEDRTVTEDALRKRIAYLIASTHLITLRQVARNFLSLAVSHKSKTDIEALLYSHLCRRLEKSTW